MRFDALVTAAIVPAVLFGAAAKQSVGPSSVQQKPVVITASFHKTIKPKIITVKSGDYLEKIAKANHTTSQRLFNANKVIKDPDLIYPGQKLRVPDAKEKLKERQVDSQAVVQSPSRPVKPSYSRPAVKSYSRAYNPAPVNRPNYATGNTVWDRIAACESGGNWSINTGNGFYGGLQFTLSSWQAVGGVGYPNQASRAEQIARAQILQSRQGWGAWPACSAKLGLR